MEAGNQKNAERAWRRAVQLDPFCNLAWANLVDLLARAGRQPEAAACLDRLVAISERSAKNLLANGETYLALQRNQEGRALLQEALALDSSLRTKIGLLLAKLDWNEGDFASSIRVASEILTREPDNLTALAIRTQCWSRLTWVPEEIADERRYLHIKPDAEVHGAMLFSLNYLAETTPESLYEESRRWNEMYAAPLTAGILPHSNSPDPERSLKVGYLSADLHAHTIMKLLPAVFELYDKHHFEVFIYSISTTTDSVSEFIQRQFKNLILLPPEREEIVRRVRSDAIDILVDLGGHTMHADSYLTFALKPAPVQVTWMGSLATTGLDTMDYFIGDASMPCPGTEHLFSEKVYRLPRVHCCFKPEAEREIVQSPYFENGYITFGCFNTPRKLTRDVVRLWSIILHLHPESKLLLKYAHLEKALSQARLREWFAGNGIAASRLEFEGWSKGQDYLGAWNKVDIALDPFPYNGGTTSMDALWMGVPIVTMTGRLAVNCAGASLLSAVGFPIANTPEQYVELATSLVQTIPAQPDLRRRVRRAMASSELMDELGMTRAIETAYRAMWCSWCVSVT